VQRLFVG